MSNRVLAGIFLVPPILLALYRDFYHPLLLAASILAYVIGWLLIVFSQSIFKETITVEKIKYVEKESEPEPEAGYKGFRYHDLDLRKQMIIEVCERLDKKGEKLTINKVRRMAGGSFYTVRDAIRDYQKQKGK